MDFLATLQAAPPQAAEELKGLFRRAGRATRHGYPFGNPVSIEKSHVDWVRHSPYKAAVKTDGVRVCLAFTKSHAGTPVSYVMTRKGSVFGLPVLCAGELFNGSFFDAELVRTRDGQHHMYVFDVAMSDGDVTVEKDCLDDRLELIRGTFPSTPVGNEQTRRNLIREGYVFVNLPGVHALSKPMFDVATELDKLIAFAAALDHAHDGYVLTPSRAPTARPGTAWDVLKIKDKHTLDLQWDGHEGWFGSGDELFPAHYIDDPVRVVLDVASFKDVSPGDIVECVPRLRDGDAVVELAALQVRKDAVAPNQALCVQRTLRSVMDAVTLEDVRPKSAAGPQ